jgi:hypothetical protein
MDPRLNPFKIRRFPFFKWGAGASITIDSWVFFWGHLNTSGFHSEINMSFNQSNKHNDEYDKKHDPSFVEYHSKGGSKGYIKRDKGPQKHHISYGRHKVDEKLIDSKFIYEVVEEIHEDAF